MTKAPIGLQFRSLRGCSGHCRLVTAQPSAPTVFGRDDSTGYKFPGPLAEMSSVAQHSFGIAGVLNLQDRSAVLKLFLQPNERVRAEFSPTPRLFHLWRVVDQVYLCIRALQQKVMPAGAFPQLPLRRAPALCPSSVLSFLISSTTSGKRSSESRAPWDASIFCRSLLRCIAFKTVSKSRRTSHSSGQSVPPNPSAEAQATAH